MKEDSKLLLAFDGSGTSLSLAFFYDEQILGEKFLNISNQHSVNLLPAINSFREELDLKYSQLKAIAVAIGPGSFTGIRIAVSTANTMAYALDIPVIGISSLASLAEPFFYREKILLPSFDARGGRVYAAFFRKGKRLVEDQQYIDDELPRFIKDRFLENRSFVLIGDGYPTVKNLCDQYDIPYYRPIDFIQKTDYISAASLGNIAIRIIMEQGSDFPKTFCLPVKPTYCALTQAERNLQRDKQNF
ncbi:MAG TPA: tRNA (adenosine(37)-N6)-threonylcarbamoyltransferase complex dimerization subunit type 1 TsaB [Candidatus Eisenbacteria bacterium]|nr:tRNA (adenosine(37)-N6)-threonylcarbamoyltransferase complex dimerization subunit type 1 TsaB [Candidatus Eisenbacteria bacterium]